jgi:Tryptophan halogenase
MPSDSPQNKAIRSILVVGGGTAGWLSALYLQRALGATVNVELIESKTIPRIGVGEATVPSFRHTMAFLGFVDEDWMAQVGATYKLAVRFEQWNKPASEGLDCFYHPFFERNEPLVQALPPYFPELGDGQSLMHFWHKKHLQGETKQPYAYAVFPGPRMCDERKAPRFKDSLTYEVPSAHHLDAHKFAVFMTKKAVERGIKHTIGDVTEVKLDENGFISGIMTKENGELKADLYIDCSGFRSLILNGALKEPFASAAKSLWNDSAVAMRPRNEPGDLAPYTLARASDAGWMWNIPLYHRAGTGYVYSSKYKSKEDAELELRTYLGPRADADTSVNHLKFKTGRYERTWVKNCVGIGLAANFIEPLESTTIFLIEYGLAQLVTFFPDRQFLASRAERYNRLVSSMYDEVRDFITLHFVGGKRRDTEYWRDLADKRELPDSMMQQLDFYSSSLPLGERFQNFVFRERSYACLLAGLGLVPKTPYPLLAHVGDEAAERAFREIAARTEDLAARLPGQREYLEHLYRQSGLEFLTD